MGLYSKVGSQSSQVYRVRRKLKLSASSETDLLNICSNFKCDLIHSNQCCKSGHPVLIISVKRKCLQ